MGRDTLAAPGAHRWRGCSRVSSSAVAPSRDAATFYSALYRSLLHPNVFSDDNGQYAGFDRRVHTSRDGPQYSNFSSWDIYRSEIPLLAMIAAPEASAMMRSLLADYDQSGWLPKWPYTDVETAEMNGDSTAPIFAEAYAFGAATSTPTPPCERWCSGATTMGTGLGWDVERQDLDEYLRQGWIEADRRDRTSFDYTIGGSETLEYAIDDCAIVQLATRLGDRAVAAAFTGRAGELAPPREPGDALARRAPMRRGSSPRGSAFQPSPLPGIGQDGWEEGNSIQYSWSVPQDLRGLIVAMGGNATAVTGLIDFFAQPQHEPEPAVRLGRQRARARYPRGCTTTRAPVADARRRAPHRARSCTRPRRTGCRATTTSVRCRRGTCGPRSGCTPRRPGRADLALASPLFRCVTVHLSSGHSIVITAPGASTRNRYVHVVR